jgi:SRSO17 transposase
MLRVVPFHDDGYDPSIREDVWLLIEWPRDEDAPSKYFFATLPRKTTCKRLVRVVKERYRTERLYEDLKGELGLDHYEGRSYPGWNHHVSCVLGCYAFVLGERVRRFSPSPRRLRAARPHRLAA